MSSSRARAIARPAINKSPEPTVLLHYHPGGMTRHPWSPCAHTSPCAPIEMAIVSIPRAERSRAPTIIDSMSASGRPRSRCASSMLGLISDGSAVTPRWSAFAVRV